MITHLRGTHVIVYGGGAETAQRANRRPKVGGRRAREEIGKGKTVRERQLKDSACVVDCLMSTN